MNEFDELMKTQKVTSSQVTFAPTPRGNQPSQIVQSSAIFGGKNECHSIQDSVIKIRPSPKTLLIQQVEKLGKIIAQVIALEAIGHYRPCFKEHALLLLQEEVFTQQRSLHYLHEQFLKQEQEFIEARNLQISKVQILMPLLPTEELQNELKLFVCDQKGVQQNLRKAVTQIETQKNYHCVLLNDQTGQELIKLIKIDSREMTRDAYFLQVANSPQLKEFWKQTIIYGVQQNKFSYNQLKEFVITIQSNTQVLQEISLAQSVFEEINDYLTHIITLITIPETQISAPNKQQLKTLKLLYDGMCSTPENDLDDLVLPEIVYPILINTSLLIKNSIDEYSRSSMIEQIENQLKHSKQEVDNFILFSQLFVSSQLQTLMLAYAENCKNNQQIDPELFKFRTILPLDKKTLEQLLSLPTNNESSILRQEIQDETNIWFQFLNYIGILLFNDSEENKNALSQHATFLLQNKEQNNFGYYSSLFEQLLMLEKVHEYAFEQIQILSQSPCQQHFQQHKELMQGKLNLYSLLIYYRNFEKKHLIEQKLILQIDLDFKDDFQDLLVAIYKYNENQQEQFLNSVRQVYKKEFKTQLQQLSENNSNQIQSAIKLIFQKIHV